MERRFETVQKLINPPPTYISCSIQKLPSNPKVNKNSCSLSMFMSYNFANPMEIRFQKTTKKL